MVKGNRTGGLLLAASLLSCQSIGGNLLPGETAVYECASASPVEESVFLIGDAGAPELPKDETSIELVDPVLRALHQDVLREIEKLGPDRVTTVFLGDNVYPKGLVPAGEKDRRRGERVLEAQIRAALPGRAIFLAGNHDWEIEGPQGWEHVTAQREFLASQGPRVSMLPPGGCAGPFRRDFGSHLRFVFLDPIGWQHTLISPTHHKEVCPHPEPEGVVFALADEFDYPEGRHVVLALHHPLVTAGPHGGNFTWKQHLFPLTDFVSWLWIPLPGLGSIYPISRQLGVTSTDISSGPYRGVIRGIYRASRPRVPILVAAGHEHSLQVHRDLVGLTYAVSGAGSSKKANRVEPSATALLEKAVPGFMRLDTRHDGSLELEVIEVESADDVSSIFTQCIAEGPAETSRP